MCKKILVFLGPPIILRRAPQYPVCGWPAAAYGAAPSPFCCPQQQQFINPAAFYGNGYGLNGAAGFHPQAQLVNIKLSRNSPLLQLNNCGGFQVQKCRC